MHIHFYWVRPTRLKAERPIAGSQQGLVLVDTPGYGFAVGHKTQLETWKRLLTSYVHNSPSLCLAVCWRPTQS